MTVQVQIQENGYAGRSECRPYARYNETAESVISQIENVKAEIENGLSLQALNDIMPAGAARNALDCALWDLQAKRTERPVWDMADIPEPGARETAFTLSMDNEANMIAAAKAARKHKILKIKIGAENGLNLTKAVLSARPDAQLIIDANEALNSEDLREISQINERNRIAMIEQPFPASADKADLFPKDFPIPLCADESLHTSEDLPRLCAAGYRVVNVKLDKTGGLTEALKVVRLAKDMGFKIMAGCMVGSSLAMTPMIMLESFADFIDLDGPLLLSDDFDPPLTYKGGKIFPPSKELWG